MTSEGANGSTPHIDDEYIQVIRKMLFPFFSGLTWAELEINVTSSKYKMFSIHFSSVFRSYTDRQHKVLICVWTWTEMYTVGGRENKNVNSFIHCMVIY